MINIFITFCSLVNFNAFIKKIYLPEFMLNVLFIIKFSWCSLIEIQSNNVLVPHNRIVFLLDNQTRDLFNRTYTLIFWLAFHILTTMSLSCSFENWKFTKKMRTDMNELSFVLLLFSNNIICCLNFLR